MGVVVKADSGRPSSDVSVVIPSYNGILFISEAIGSVFDQTRPPREIIVVDDASTDGTADLVASIACQAPLRIQLVRLSTNSGGPAHPMNVGIGVATGRYIAILDQDDRFTPERLAELREVFRRFDDQIALAISNSLITSHDPESRLHGI